MRHVDFLLAVCVSNIMMPSAAEEPHGRDDEAGAGPDTARPLFHRRYAARA